MPEPLITVITPTTGKDSLKKLMDSLDNQTAPFVHILLWDDKREDSYLFPESGESSVADPLAISTSREDSIRRSYILPGTFVQGTAYGSALRAVGLMAANTPYVTFADDDVWFEKTHLEELVELLKYTNTEWGYGVRKIWTNSGEYLGEDHFESVGADSKKRVPYEMIDNNTMIFTRRFGASAAVLYRETKDYNDDRLMYVFLKKYAGLPSTTSKATINQTCPAKLEDFFRQGCIK